MKKIKGVAIVLLAIISHASFGQLEQPRTSPQAEVRQTIGITEVSVKYSRPSVITEDEDRTGQIWGDVVSYGFNKIWFGYQQEIPWRAGADENTTITFEDSVRIDGKDVAPGTYGFYVALYEDGKATVILSSNSNSWGSFWYHEKFDVLRVDVQSDESTFQNLLTYSFDEVGADYGILSLKWENKVIPLRIDVDVHKIAVASFHEELKSDLGFGWTAPLEAARYCLENNIVPDKGLRWSEWALNNGRNFGTLTTRAGMLLKFERNEEADSLFQQAVEIGGMWDINFYGVQLMNADEKEEALKVFQLNVDKNPMEAYMYYSLGDVYKELGEKSKAMKNAKKGLTLEPNDWTKKRLEGLLKELGT